MSTLRPGDQVPAGPRQPGPGQTASRWRSSWSCWRWPAVRHHRLARALGLDRSPLRRASDRAEAWIRVGLLAVLLIVGPMAAGAAGAWADHAGITGTRVQAAQTSHDNVPAVALPPVFAGGLAEPTQAARLGFGRRREQRWRGDQRDADNGGGVLGIRRAVADRPCIAGAFAPGPVAGSCEREVWRGAETLGDGSCGTGGAGHGGGARCGGMGPALPVNRRRRWPRP
jgi:hypothetical protein